MSKSKRRGGHFGRLGRRTRFESLDPRIVSKPNRPGDDAL